MIFQSKQNDVEGFNKSYNDLMQLLDTQPDYYAHPERAKGYFFSKMNQKDSSICYYRRFWNKHLNDSLCYFSLLEVSGTLSLMYRAKLNFDSALYFQKQNILVLTNSVIGKDLPWKEVLSPKIYNRNKYIFISYFFTMQTFINKFESQKDDNALIQAFEISKLSDEKLYQSIFSPDEGRDF